MQPQPRFQRRKERTGRVFIAIGLALVGHFLFLALLLLWAELSPPRPHEPPPEAVSLRTLSESDWARNRGDRAPVDSNEPRQLAQEPKPEPPKPPEKNPHGQVVDVAPGNEQESPDAKYLAEHNNKVDRETRAKEQTPHYKNAMPHRTTTSPTPQQGHDAAEVAENKGNGGMGHDDRPLQSASPKHGAMEVPDVKPQQEIAMRRPEEGQGAGLKIPNTPQSDALHGNSSRLHMEQGAPGQGAENQQSLGSAGNPGMANLMPSQATMDKLAGAAPNDKLDADEGDGTFLNTREWKYASFFNRVKQAVGMHWDPATVLRQRDPTGNIYGNKDRYTLLQVTLSDRGTVKEIHVDKGCGVEFLDEEAIAAFQRAQPFPNPPSGLVESDGAVHFQFGFFLEMNQIAHLRLFRPAE